MVQCKLVYVVHFQFISQWIVFNLQEFAATATRAICRKNKCWQWFEVDVTLWLDLSQAGKSDDIQHTLDYRSAITLIQRLVKNSKFLLIEKLADAIAQALLELALVEKVKIQLSKPAAPIPDFGGRITLEITRTKDSN